VIKLGICHPGKKKRIWNEAVIRLGLRHTRKKERRNEMLLHATQDGIWTSFSSLTTIPTGIRKCPQCTSSNPYPRQRHDTSASPPPFSTSTLNKHHLAKKKHPRYDHFSKE